MQHSRPRVQPPFGAGRASKEGPGLEGASTPRAGGQASLGRAQLWLLEGKGSLRCLASQPGLAGNMHLGARRSSVLDSLVDCMGAAWEVSSPGESTSWAAGGRRWVLPATCNAGDEQQGSRKPGACSVGTCWKQYPRLRKRSPLQCPFTTVCWQSLMSCQLAKGPVPFLQSRPLGVGLQWGDDSLVLAQPVLGQFLHFREVRLCGVTCSYKILSS